MIIKKQSQAGPESGTDLRIIHSELILIPKVTFVKEFKIEILGNRVLKYPYSRVLPYAIPQDLTLICSIPLLVVIGGPLKEDRAASKSIVKELI